MSFLKEVNKARRGVMRGITGSLGKTRLDKAVDGKKVKIERVLICRPNHRLGNLLLITPLIQELAGALPHAKLDLFVKGTIAPIIFKNYQNIDRILQLPKKPFKDLFRFLYSWTAIRRRHYDLVINVVFNSSSGRISARTANATYRFLGDIDSTIPLKFADHDHMAKFPVYSFRHFISALGYPLPSVPVPPLDLKLDASEISAGRKILNDLVKNDKRTIAIYTYATGHKCYDKEWWGDFYGRLKTRFPAYNIIEVLPIENVSQIAFEAPAFYSKDIREIGGLIANTDVFIGADSGMMHLASAAGAPVIGLFKSDNMSTYAPYNDGSRGVSTNDLSPDECLDVIGSVLAERGLLASADGAKQRSG